MKCPGVRCPNEGTDPRVFRCVTCWLQSRLSFHWPAEPPSVLLAFPPFVAINLPLPHRLAEWLRRSTLPADRRWYLLLRVGWRYDKHWLDARTGVKGGFIFPEAAVKLLHHTVFY